MTQKLFFQKFLEKFVLAILYIFDTIKWFNPVKNSTNIDKTKESLISEGQEFHQYRQNKRQFNQWRSRIPPIISIHKTNKSPLTSKHWS